MLAAPAYALAGDDPAPVPRPDALQQPVKDGCQRNPAGLLTFTSPEWVYVYSHDPVNPDPSKARVVEGTSRFSDTAVGDLPQSHAYYDFNTDVAVNSGYEYLMGGDPDAHNGNFADSPPNLHVEWESGTLPPFAWPTAGDDLKLWGSWVWDCGHWGQGFTADPNDPTGSIVNDTDYFLPGTNQTGGLRGEQTEFHPMDSVIVTRSNPTVPEVGETETDAFISTQGNTAHSDAFCAHNHPATSPIAYGPDWSLCEILGASAHQTVNDRDYSFFVPAPPRPAPGVPLRVRVVDQLPGSTHPQEQITPRSNGIEVTVPFKGFGSASQLLQFSKSFFVGWEGPVQDRPAHVQVKLKQIKILHSLDDPAVSTSAGIPPGEWELYSDVNGLWSWLNPFAPKLGAVNTGDVVDINHTFNLHVPAGKPLQLMIDGRECDLPKIQPCPATSEVAEDDDNPGSAQATFEDIAGAAGEHTLAPAVADPNWRMTYDITPLSAATKGPPAGPGCFDTFAPSTRAGAGRRHHRVVLHGTANDRGCPGGIARIRSVGVSISRYAGHHRCRQLRPNRTLSRPGSCGEWRFLRASGKRRWRLRLPRSLPPGHYTVRSRAIDAAGNVELATSDLSHTAFRTR